MIHRQAETLSNSRTEIAEVPALKHWLIASRKALRAWLHLLKDSRNRNGVHQCRAPNHQSCPLAHGGSFWTACRPSALEQVFGGLMDPYFIEALHKEQHCRNLVHLLNA